MKLIEAMKKLKDLNVKAEDLRNKVALNCVNLNIETPLYGADQKATVDGWIQSHSDILQEILKLRFAVQRTNIATPVTIELGGKQVTKTIAEWIHRRRDLAKLDMDMWGKLGDRGLKEQNIQNSTGGPTTEIRIVRYYDPKERDAKVGLYRSEPSTIDATLEIVNATTELVN